MSDINQILQMPKAQISDHQRVEQDNNSQPEQRSIQIQKGTYTPWKIIILSLFLIIAMVSLFAYIYHVQVQELQDCSTIKQKRRKKFNPNWTLTERVSLERGFKGFQRNFDENPLKIKFPPPFKFYYSNNVDYLIKNNVTSVFQIGCQENCKKNYLEDPQKGKLNVSHFSSASEDFAKKYQWIVIRQIKLNTSLVAFTNLASISTQKGLTIILKNMDELRQFNSKFREIVFELTQKHQLTYDETSSLGLRRREGRVLFIFTKNPRKSAELPFKKPIKNQIGIQVVVKLNENILYLREWIGYHIYLGVDKFFFYDNNGTIGYDSNIIRNKLGFKFECLNLTEQKIVQEWNQIWQDFYEHIIYIPWQYQDKNGQIIYGQVQSQGDFIQTFEDVTTYVGFIDPDEMLFSEQNLDFPETLSKHSIENYTSIRLFQKKFTNRFCFMSQKLTMTKINEVFVVPIMKQEGQKLFLETENFVPFGSIHEGLTTNGKRYFYNDFSRWRFNHYNLNEDAIYYYQKRNKTKETKMSYDSSAQERYGELINKICQGKCTEKFNPICSMQKCPKMNQQYYPISYS